MKQSIFPIAAVGEWTTILSPRKIATAAFLPEKALLLIGEAVGFGRPLYRSAFIWASFS